MWEFYYYALKIFSLLKNLSAPDNNPEVCRILFFIGI